MADNYGKNWETEFRSGWKRSFPNGVGWVYRLADQMSGYKDTSGNPCDFLAHAKGKLFMVECKSHKGASIPFTAIIQYSRLLNHKGFEDIHPGILIWFSDKNLVFWVDINEAEKMYNNGEKSIGIRMLDDPQYNILSLPFPPIKGNGTYPKVDYNYLVDYYKKEA